MKSGSKIILITIIILAAIVIGTVLYFSISHRNENTTSTTNTALTEETQQAQQTQQKQKAYTIINSDFYLHQDVQDREEEYRGVKLLEYDTHDNYSEIYYILYDYSTDGSVYYTVEITDKENKNIILDGKTEEEIMGGIVSSIKIKTMSLQDTINFSVFEKDIQTKDVVESAKTQINLTKNVEEKTIIDQNINLKNGTLGDVKFKYIDSEDVYFGTTSHSYSQNLVGENCSIPVKVQYGNKLFPEGHIDFSYDQNVNNLELEEAFEALALINNTFGQYGLSDMYGMDITNEQKEVIYTVVITFQDMLDLCNGLEIEKNGEKYTKNSFEGFAEMTMTKDKKVEIGKGITAIQYHYEPNHNEEQHYLFIVQDKIYQLSVPINEKINNKVEEFIKSLEL